MNARYYAQRASAGLIISEATQVSPEGAGFPNTPGIHSDKQVEGWKLVTDAVHQAGGRIVAQLWHAGRIAHPANLPEGYWPVAPSEIRPAVKAYVEGTDSYRLATLPQPRRLTTAAVAEIVQAYRRAARNAFRAGFDGVEVHAAFGYLIDQFIRSGTNRRKDIFGGSLQNRLRFPLEVVDAVISVWGPGRVGVRITPLKQSNDALEPDLNQTYGAFTAALSDRNIAFLEVVETGPGGKGPTELESESLGHLRMQFGGLWIGNGNLTGADTRRRIDSGEIDAASFGRPFITNPDLPFRLAQDLLLTEPDPDTFYGGDKRGYVDYPTWNASNENIIDPPA